MTEPGKTLVDDVKSTVSVRLLDPLGKSIEGLKYQIREGKKIVAKGVTDAEGNISSFLSKLGTELTVHVERFASEEMKQVKTLVPWAENFRVKLISGKVKKEVTAKKDTGSPGEYKRKTYIVKKDDTLSKIAVRFGTTAAALAKLNGIKLEDVIHVDQVLKVPAEKKPALGAAAAAAAKPAALAAPVSAPPAATQGAVPAQADAENEAAGPGTTAAATDTGSEKEADVEPTAEEESALAKEEISIIPPVVADAPGPKTIPIVPQVPTTTEEARGENGTPKTTVNLECDKTGCIKIGAKSSLVEEINIRLCGFGGTIESPKSWDEFTKSTENAVKQFEKDYMGVAEPTGRVCGAVLRAIDEFGSKYGASIKDMKCHCGLCSKFGNGRKDSLQEGMYSAKNVPFVGIEYPGMHRGLLWGWKATQFYMLVVEKDLGYEMLAIDSAYRCWHDNKIHNRTSSNHMGNALDIHFKKNGQRVINDHMDIIRAKIFQKHLKAQILWPDRNKFSLEPKFFYNKKTKKFDKKGAPSWVHVDVRTFDDRYKLDRFYAVTQEVAEGKSLVELAKNASYFKLVNCGGIPRKSVAELTTAKGSAAVQSKDKPASTKVVAPPQTKDKPASSPASTTAGSFRVTIQPLRSQRDRIASECTAQHFQHAVPLFS